MMKKALSVFLMGLVLLFAVGCGSDKPKEQNTNAAQQSTSQLSSEIKQMQEKAEKEKSEIQQKLGSKLEKSMPNIYKDCKVTSEFSVVEVSANKNGWNTIDAGIKKDALKEIKQSYIDVLKEAKKDADIDFISKNLLVVIKDKNGTDLGSLSGDTITVK